MSPIIYGYPTEAMIDEARLDRVVLGGPTIKEFTHFCHYCQETFPLPEN
jgi:hypothetical protein